MNRPRHTAATARRNAAALATALLLAGLALAIHALAYFLTL